jgi:hypothetical protein
MQKNLTEQILNSLVHSDSYCRKALPHIKSEYFEKEYRPVYELVLSFIRTYNKLPTSATLHIELNNSKYASRGDVNDIVQLISSLENTSDVDEAWLLNSTEKFCKDRAVQLAIMESLDILDGKRADVSEGSIPEILSKALSVSFDSNIGHDYIENAEERFNFYHKKEDKTPFDIEMLNTITKGGVSRKTLNVILAGCVHPDTGIKIRLRKKV